MEMVAPDVIGLDPLRRSSLTARLKDADMPRRAAFSQLYRCIRWFCAGEITRQVWRAGIVLPEFGWFAVDGR